MINIGCIMCYFHSISGVNPIATTRHPFEVLSQLTVTGDRRFQPNQPMRHYDDLSTDFETPIDIVHLRSIERKDIPRPKTRKKLPNNLHPIMNQTNQKDDQHATILFPQKFIFLYTIYLHS